MRRAVAQRNSFNSRLREEATGNYIAIQSKCEGDSLRETDYLQPHLGDESLKAKAPFVHITPLHFSRKNNTLNINYE